MSVTSAFTRIEDDMAGDDRAATDPVCGLPRHEGAESGARSYTLGAHRIAVAAASPGLHIVATPIGHLGDISLRALETLAGVDAIACEDSRVTHRLLERYGIRQSLTPYHEHNAATARPALLARLAEGEAIALVSDAGTPLISDPGYKLVREALAGGHAVHAVPGPSAVMAALTLAGLPTDRFFFEGFLSPKEQARRVRAGELAAVDASLVLFETGPRLAAALADLAHALGPRPAAICRELTKMHEEIRRGPLDQLAQQAPQRETRGEFVIVIAPPDRAASSDPADLDALLRSALAAASVKDAVARVVRVTGAPRRVVYGRALALMQDDEGRR